MVLSFLFVGDAIVVRHIAASCAGYWVIWKSAVRHSSVTVKPKKAKKPIAIQRTAVATEKNPNLKQIWMITLPHPYPEWLSFI